MRSQLDESKYEQKHAPECVRDECFEYLAEDYRFQPPQTRRVSNLLKAGSTPQVILNLDGNIQLKTSYRYVAISHVWSDGLGNPHRNSLHSCQIGRIQRMVNDLYPGETESVPFWLDTLCVPLDPETRKLAISGMKQVYEQADRVLILDSDLIDAPYDMDIYETVMRVATCTWSTRLWTLQEAMFQSKTIYALPARPWTGDMFWGVGVLSHFKQFKLPQEQSEHVLQNSQIQKRAYLNLLLAWGTHVIEWQGKPFREFIEGIDVPADNTLSRIQSALNTRATSKIEDEPICLASLLGINPKKLFGTKDSASRMRHVFRSMKQIPTGFLFAPRPRIRDYGCRWMPQSLLWNEESTSYLGDYNQQAPVDQDGMLVTMPGIRFPHGLSPDDDDSRVITVELDGGELDGQRYEKATWEISFSFPKPESMKDPQQPWLACKGQDVAIVMSDLPGADWHGRRACILVAVRELSEEFVIRRMGQDPEMATRLFARYEACVKLKLSAKLPTRPNYHIGSGAYELLGKDQNWCIG
ncbi:hypothetical protein PVAG01_00318 [Phlyctema vagabunda]|uniref:Heterokaryon incompatibility domain-containing protein n=1 Tax=Phlyctema vagabunda TaxID=108571 RepID=A0ABR4PTX3_9HELO